LLGTPCTGVFCFKSLNPADPLQPGRKRVRISEPLRLSRNTSDYITDVARFTIENQLPTFELIQKLRPLKEALGFLI
jgi:hypothetical protein